MKRAVLPIRRVRQICRRCVAFTLVELLVVIGIIALLVGILLPALSHARQQANLIVCQTHMRQLGQAIALYVVDNQGRDGRTARLSI